MTFESRQPAMQKLHLPTIQLVYVIMGETTKCALEHCKRWALVIEPVATDEIKVTCLKRRYNDCSCLRENCV